VVRIHSTFTPASTGVKMVVVHPPDTVIRPAAPGDLAAVAAIFAHYVTSSVVTFEVTPPTAEHWRRTRDELAARGLPFLVCQCADRVAGYAYATQWRAKPAYQHTVESTIYLAPDLTGRGLGRQLLGALQRHCALAGMEQMIAVIADSGDSASAALHRACGFTDVGRLRNVGRKHGRLIDTLLMQHDLTTDTRGCRLR
jgi:L-amino acid N-acyltransferase YncA